jgi:hypothetical protein
MFIDRFVLVSNDSISNFQFKIKRVKDSLKGWGINIKGKMKKYRKSLLEEIDYLESLEETNSLSGDQYARKGTVQLNLMNSFRQEEKYWFDRSSEKWLLQRITTLPFFIEFANGRLRKNAMYSLKFEGGVV